MRKTTLLATLALAGCATYQHASLPVTTEQNIGIPLPWGIIRGPYRVYSNIRQDTVEQELIHLAQTSEYEESWLYLVDTAELIEVGHSETHTQSTCTYNPEMFQKSKRVISYHIHPLRNIATFFTQHKKDALNVQERLNTQRIIGALPSGGDFKHQQAYRDLAASYGSLLEMRVADHEGITVAAAKEQLTEKQCDLIDGANIDYWNERTTIETVKAIYQENGIMLTYTRQQKPTITVSKEKSGRLKLSAK